MMVSKKLRPGMRVRVTGLTEEVNPRDTTFCRENYGRDWFFPIPSEATLLHADQRDRNGDWWVKFDDGRQWWLESKFVEFEVIEG